MVGFNASNILTRMPQWVVGQLLDTDIHNEKDDALNKAPQVAEAWTITIDTVTASAVYAWIVNGADLSVTASASATNETINAQIVAAINNDFVSGSVGLAVRTSATVVTVTGHNPGIVFDVSDADAKLTCVNTVNADDADPISFGRLVISPAIPFDGEDRCCVIATSAYMTAQVDSWAITYEAAIELIVTLTVDGIPYRVSHTMATDLDTSIDALVIKVNGVMAGLPAATVIATANLSTATALVLTSEVAGKAFVSSVSLGVGATAAAPVRTTNAGRKPDVNLAALGVSYRSAQECATVAGQDPRYPGNSSVLYVKKGAVAVALAAASGAAIVDGDPVYVELATGASSGKFYTETSATRVLLTRAKWIVGERSGASNGVAALRFS